MILRYLALLATLAAILAGGPPAAAQTGNPFAPALLVNGRSISNFEIEQRMRMMELFRTPGDLEELATEALIEDRLRLDAAAEIGVVVLDEQIEAGMAEFAERANMDAEAFIAALAEAGVAMETFRDFVRAGVAWREVVRQRFGPRAQVTEAEAEDALSQGASRGAAAALVAEIVLPARDREEAARAQALAEELKARISSIAEFAAAAREVSVSPTRENGGRLPEALALEDLPGPIRSQVLTMRPGEVTDPITAPNAVALFQLIELRDLGVRPADQVEVAYARYLIPGGRSEAALAEAGQIIGRVDTCNDLYGINKGKDPRRLAFETVSEGALGGDIGRELARLDPGEISTSLTRGDNLLLLMLCTRRPVRDEEPDLDNVRGAVFNQRLGRYGDAYLAELRANALIRFP